MTVVRRMHKHPPPFHLSPALIALTAAGAVARLGIESAQE
jgi:hypothetical protein